MDNLHLISPLVSVVILNYNGKAFLSNCLASVSKTKYPNFEVILVDNASTDKSTLFNPKMYNLLNCKIIQNKENLGFAEGNNVGVRAAHGKYIVILNNDTEVEANWLDVLVSVMESNYDIGIAQSNLILFDKKTIDSTGDFIDFYGNGLLRRHGHTVQGLSREDPEIFSARGAAMMIRKDIIDNIGCFDPYFFMLCEDVDLSWRVRLNGFKVVFVQDSIVYHCGSGTRKTFQSSARSGYYNTRNGLILLIKNYKLRNLFVYGSIKVLFQSFLFLSALPFRNKRGYNLSRLAAFYSVFSNLAFIWKLRANVQSGVRRVSDKEIRKLMINKNLALLELIWFVFYRHKFQYYDYLNKVLPI